MPAMPGLRMRYPQRRGKIEFAMSSRSGKWRDRISRRRTASMARGIGIFLWNVRSLPTDNYQFLPKNGNWLPSGCYGYMNTISTYNTYLSTHQLSDHSESSIGWIFSVYSLLTFFCGIQIGPVFDVRGPRLLVLAGSIMLMGICSRVFILNIYITYYYITRKYL